MTKNSFPLVLIIAVLMASCTSLPSATPAATAVLPAAADEWTITMNHSGGIMGLMRSVVVSDDGNYTVTDERTKNKVTGKLTTGELAKLSGLVTSIKLNASNMPGVGACADCFIYDINIQSSGEKFNVQLDDTTLPGSGMEELVAFLRGTIDSALK